MKIKKYKVILINLIAFAVAAFFFFKYYSEKKKSSNREGFRDLRVEAIQQKAGWGYRIYQDTSAIIEQLLIPGVSGNRSFSTKEEAVETGKLVEYKLKKGIFPPTVTLPELDSMEVNYK